MNVSLRIRLLLGLLVAIAGLALTLSASSQAGPTGARWNPVQAMPSGATYIDDSLAANNAQVLTSPTGPVFLYYLDGETPMLAQFNSDGSLGTPAAIPGAGGAANLGQVHFLTDGDAVFSWTTEYGTYLAYRSAAGTWGTPLGIDATDDWGWDVRAGELLAVVNHAGTVDADSYSIDSNGDFSDTPSVQGILTGVAQGPVTVALDPNDAAATVVIDVQTSDVLTSVSRDSTGTWSSTTQPLAQTGAVNPYGAVAPDGRAIVGWTTLEGGTPQTVSWEVRDPGGSFGDLGQQTYGSASPYEVAAVPFDVAAGPDGTLALAFTSIVCDSVGDSSGSSVQALDIPPGHDTGSIGPVPGSAWSISDGSGTSSDLTSLGAGDGEAIVGFETNDSPQNGECASSTGEDTWNDTTEVSIFGQDGAPGTVQLDSYTQMNSPSDAGAGAAGLDIDGDAVVIGGFTTQNPGYETFGTPGSATGSGTTSSMTTTTSTPSNTSPTTASTATNPTPTPTPSPSPSPTKTSTAPPAGTTTTPTPSDQIPPTAPGTVSQTGTVSPNGTQTVTVDNTSGIQEQYVAALYSGGAGFVQAVVMPRKTTAKPVLIASARATVRPHKKAALKLKLSRAAFKQLKAKHKLKVTLKLTVTAKGHRATVVTRTLTLNRA